MGCLYTTRRRAGTRRGRLSCNITARLNKEVELSASPDRLRTGVADIIAGGFPIGDDCELTNTGERPSGFLHALARQRVEQSFAEFDMATDDIPATREKGPLPGSAMHEYSARAVTNDGADDAMPTITFGIGL